MNAYLRQNEKEKFFRTSHLQSFEIHRLMYVGLVL
jgi:hypothetical protein